MFRVLSVSLCVGISLSALAQTPDNLARAEQLYIEADKHYALQEYKEAMEKFKESFRLSDEPALLFNIGQCQFALEQYKEAEASYKTFLRRTPADDPNRALAEKKIADAQEALAKLKTTTPTEPSSTTLSTSIASTPSTEEPTPTKSKAPLLYGLAGATGAAGVVTLASAFSLRADVAELTERDDSQALRVAIEGKLQRAGQMATCSAVLFGVAATTAVIGVVSTNKKGKTISLSITPNSVVLGGQF